MSSLGLMKDLRNCFFMNETKIVRCLCWWLADWVLCACHRASVACLTRTNYYCPGRTLLDFGARRSDVRPKGEKTWRIVIGF